MDSQRLIEEITELVVRQLAGMAPACEAAPPAIGPQPAGAGPRVLVVMGAGRRGMEEFAAQMRLALEGGGQAVLVASESWPVPRATGLLPTGRGQVLDRSPYSWETLVRDCRAVVIPNLTVNALAGIALLAALEPCAGAAVQALIEGVPVLAGCDELNFLQLNAAHLTKPFLDVLRGHLSTVQALGVRLVEVKTLGEEVARAVRGIQAVSGSGRGRNVLTREDVETLLRSRPAVIEVAGGTIVTPLAREVASQAGVAIVFR